MATLTLTVNSELIDSAKQYAQSRSITLDELVEESLASVVPPAPSNANAEGLIHLMYEGRVGNIDRPMTREEIYAERTWPRS